MRDSRVNGERDSALYTATSMRAYSGGHSGKGCDDPALGSEAD